MLSIHIMGWAGAVEWYFNRSKAHETSGRGRSKEDLDNETVMALGDLELCEVVIMVS